MPNKQTKLRVHYELDLELLTNDCKLFLNKSTNLFKLVGFQMAYLLTPLFNQLHGKNTVTRQTEKPDLHGVHDTFTPQNDTVFEVGEGLNYNEYEGTFTLYQNGKRVVKCLNPYCKETFTPILKGNQVQKFCKPACKDTYHNYKKKNINSRLKLEIVQ